MRTVLPIRDNETAAANGAAASSSSGAGDRRPTVRDCGDLKKVAGTVWKVLEKTNNPPSLFRQGSVPVRIEAGDNGEPVVRHVGFHQMRYRLARDLQFVRNKAIVPPPRDLVNDVLATPDMPLPILERIVEAPVFARDGSLLTEPGYHAASRCFYAPALGFAVDAVPVVPTGADIESAREIICFELLGDFPFVGDAEKAHAVGLLLLPFARDLIDGVTPLHLIEKPTPGNGATLLSGMASFPATGRDLSSMTEGRDEDEWRKRITAKLRSGPSLVLIDNVRRRFDSAALSSAITSRAWEDRILGTSEVARIPIRCGWIATGNNPAVSSEIARRVVRIRLDAKVERPWQRTGFRHDNLRQWASDNRGLIVWAALTLIQAWIAAGRPKGSKSLGMFESWAETIGGILNVAGVPGFLSNLNEFYARSDSESQAWRDFLAHWFARFGEKDALARDLWAIATGDAPLSLGDGGEQSQKIVLGKQLTERRDRVYDVPTDDSGKTARLRIERGATSKRTTTWRLARAEMQASTSAPMNTSSA